MFECRVLNVRDVGIILVGNATNDVGVLGGIDRDDVLLDVGGCRVSVLQVVRRLFFLLVLVL